MFSTLLGKIILSERYLSTFLRMKWLGLFTDNLIHYDNQRLFIIINIYIDKVSKGESSI